MAVVDVSPTSFNTNVSQVWPSVTGRMLSIACTADGQELYCGSYSNIWASGDGGQEWEQLSWPQPDPSQYDVPGSMGGWGVVDLAATLGWRVEKHLRFLAKLTNSGFADIVGFGDCGVWTALGDGHGGFQSPHVVIPNFGYQAGGWQVDKHPRFVVDLNNDGFADIVGFGDAGVWTAIGKGDGTFQDPKLVLENFGVSQSWGIEHPRILAVTTNSGFADIVGFGDRGVYVAFGNGDGTFTLAGQPDPLPLVPDFGYIAGGWRVEKHIRVLADVNGDGFAGHRRFRRCWSIRCPQQRRSDFQLPSGPVTGDTRLRLRRGMARRQASSFSLRSDGSRPGQYRGLWQCRRLCGLKQR